MFQKIAKHRANDASNDVHRPPLDGGIAETLKALKMHFGDPSQTDKMCFEYHRVIFRRKKWVSLTVKYPLF